MKSLSAALFGGPLDTDEDYTPPGEVGEAQSGKSYQKYTGPKAFAGMQKGNFTSQGMKLSLRNDMLSAPGKTSGLLFEGVDPDNPWAH
jgi:hypothetical protein